MTRALLQLAYIDMAVTMKRLTRAILPCTWPELVPQVVPNRLAEGIGRE